MELNLIINIIERKKMSLVSSLFEEVGVQSEFSHLCYGSTQSSRNYYTKESKIDKYRMEVTDKGIVYGIGNHQATKDYIEKAVGKLLIDVPGNGLLVTIPIKSVKGGRTVAYLANNKLKTNNKKTEPKFNHEMIVVILNEGFTDAVMTAARAAGASGGTVIHAKGTNTKETEKFFGVSLANEREIIYIVTDSDKKADIMNNIDKECGVTSEVGAICFSLPVTNAIGIRNYNYLKSNK